MNHDRRRLPSALNRRSGPLPSYESVTVSDPASRFAKRAVPPFGAGQGGSGCHVALRSSASREDQAVSPSNRSSRN